MSPLERRERRLRKDYNISWLDYKAKYDAQRGRCAICCEPLEMFGHSGAHLDHDHSSQACRGILCRRHNLALGLFDDNIADLLIAIDYLSRYRGTA